MGVETVIETIINDYGSELWRAFVVLLITGFVMSLIKDLIVDTVFYFKARMSDIGFGQRIYWSGEIFIVDKISFKYIVAHDDKKHILIPTRRYMTGVIEYPKHRHDDFDETKYHQPPWDGVTDRRKK